MDGTALWVWYAESDDAEPKGGHVVAWDTDQPADDQGTPTGPPTVTLAGLADPLVAAQIVEAGRADAGLIWICPDFEEDTPTLANLLAIWGDDVRSTAVTHNGTNPTVAQEVPANTGTEAPTDGPTGDAADAESQK